MNAKDTHSDVSSTPAAQTIFCLVHIFIANKSMHISESHHQVELLCFDFFVEHIFD